MELHLTVSSPRQELARHTNNVSRRTLIGSLRRERLTTNNLHPPVSLSFSLSLSRCLVIHLLLFTVISEVRGVDIAPISVVFLFPLKFQVV